MESKDIVTSENINVELQLLASAVSLINPLIGLTFQGISSILQIGINIDSENKLKDRIIKLQLAISKINSTIEKANSNYESLIIAPEVLKQYLCVEDNDRAGEYINMLVGLFYPGKIEFDSFQEAFRVITSLSNNEYKILHLLSSDFKTWNEVFINNEHLTFKSEYAAALKNLEGKYLINIKVPLYPGSVNTMIHFSENEEACLTEYGSKVLKIIHAFQA